MRLYVLLAFVIGVGSGIGVTSILLPDLDSGLKTQPQITESVSPSPDAALIRTLQGALQEAENALEAEIQKNAAREEELAAVNTRLDLELAKSEAQLTVDAARAQERRSRFEDSIASRAARRFEAYKRVANLRPDQDAAIESLIAQYSANQIAVRDARRNGTEAPPEMDLSQLLATILDPEQITAVEAFESEIKQGRNETRATARMNRIAPRLGLDESQKDAVFGIYYTSISNNDGISASNETLVRQMEQILSPEQFAEWLKLNPD